MKIKGRVLHGRKVDVSTHAMQRARSRFRGLASKSKTDLKKTLRGVVYKGQDFGSSYIVGDFYRKGYLEWTDEPIVVSCKDLGSKGVLVATVLTPDELENAGPFRGVTVD